MKLEAFNDMSKMGGREIDWILWPGEDEPMLKADHDANFHLIMHVEYLGDRTELWVLGINNGEETRRENVRYLSSIGWYPKKP